MVTGHHPYLLPEMARKHHAAEFYDALTEHLNLTLLTPNSIQENTASIPK
jgi:methyltransferase-like protein